MNNEEKLAQWLSARPTRDPIIETMRDTFDGGDPWGSVMAWWFAIADVIYGIDPSQVPSEWEFTPSPLGPNEESYEYQQLIQGMIDEGWVLDDFQRAGYILFRYASLLKLDGHDY